MTSGMKGVAAAGLLLGMLVAAQGANELLCDFETGPDGWENENTNPPSPAECCPARARHGKACGQFKVSFSKSAPAVQFRLRGDRFPMDVTTIENFRGYSMWVYIPNGRDHWEAKMFTRSGESWVWGEGPTFKKLEPGWHRVEVLLPQIRDPRLVQDIGVQVINAADPIESAIGIDQVEILIGPSSQSAPKRH